MARVPHVRIHASGYGCLPLALLALTVSSGALASLVRAQTSPVQAIAHITKYPLAEEELRGLVDRFPALIGTDNHGFKGGATRSGVARSRAFRNLTVARLQDCTTQGFDGMRLDFAFDRIDTPPWTASGRTPTWSTGPARVKQGLLGLYRALRLADTNALLTPVSRPRRGCDPGPPSSGTAR